MRRAAHNLVLTGAILGSFTLLTFLVVYPMTQCGFWATLWLGKGAWPAVLMGMCG